MTKFRTAGSLAFGLALALALVPSAARAEGEDPASLAGTWKRDGEPARMLRLDWDAASGELVGKILNPPEDDAGKPYTVDVRLKVDGKKVEGRATWGDDNPDKGKPGQPDRLTSDARWEFELDGPNKLAGRCEYVDWQDGKPLAEKGWEPHSFERVPSVSIGTSGAGPDKVDAGSAIDAGVLGGSWRTAQGWIVAFKAADGGFSVERVAPAAGTGAFPESFKLANDGNVLKGMAKLGAVETAVELKLSAPGKLEGRAERVEGDKKSWAPWSLERLVRVDGAADANAAEPAALAAGTGTALPSLVWKRDDGLYLKLAAKDGGGFEGELSGKDGVKAKVDLAAADGKLSGKAVFTVNGAPVEAHWELALQADGSVDARCEWLDVDASSKTVVAHGVVARKFKALRRVG